MTGESAFVPPPLTLLAEHHDLSNFDCGEPSLNSWLSTSAMTAARRRLSATHVWADSDGRVLGYATLAAGAISRADLPKSIGHGYPDRIPAILLARLALHRDLRGMKLGGVLLAESLQLAARSASIVAAAFVVVDALNESVGEFYSRYGFRRIPGTRRLVLKVTTIASSSTEPAD